MTEDSRPLLPWFKVLKAKLDVQANQGHPENLENQGHQVQLDLQEKGENQASPDHQGCQEEG